MGESSSSLTPSRRPSGTAVSVLVAAGALWLLGAFAAFLAVPGLHWEFGWALTHTPAWMLDLQERWQGVPWDVLRQGALTLVLGAVAMWLGREWWGWRRGDGRDALNGAVWGGGLVLGLWGTAIFLLGLVGAWRWPRPVFGALFAGSTVAAAVLRTVRVRRLRRHSGEGATGEPGAAATTPSSPASTSSACPSSAASFAVSSRSKDSLSSAPPPSSSWSLTRAEWLVAVPVLVVQALAFLYAMTPAVQSDGLRYHLAAPQEWLKAGRMIYLPFNAFSNFPSTIEMLFLAGLGLAGDLLAKGFHFLFLPLTTLAVACLTRELVRGNAAGREVSPTSNLGGAAAGRVGREVPPASSLQPPAWAPTSWTIRPWVLAAAVWGTLPISVPLAGWEYIDLALVFFTLGIVHFLLRWVRTGRAGDWVVAAVFGGLLVASKYTGVLTVVFGAAIVVLGGMWRGRWGGHRTGHQTFAGIVARAVAFGLIAAAFGVPWWAKNVVATRNPVYPLAYSVFHGGGEWTQTCADIYASKLLEKGTPHTLGYFLEIPWNTAVHCEAFENFNIGPFFWVLTPWILFYLARGMWRWRRRSSEASLALWMAFLVGSWFFTYQSNRFLMPALALATAVALAAVGDAVEALRNGTKHGALQSDAASDSSPLVGNPPDSAAPGAFLKKAVLLLCALGVALPLAFGALKSVCWLLGDDSRISRSQGISGVRWPAYTLGFLDREAFLTDRLSPWYPAARYASENLAPGEKVLLVGEHRKFHWRCAVEGNDWYDAPRILPFLKGARTADEALDAMAAAGFTHVFFNLLEWGWPTDPGMLTGQVAVPPGGAWWYNRRHFDARELALLSAILRSQRLEPVFAPVPGKVWLARLRPQADARK